MSLELHTYDQLNLLVDTDTLGLRDYAWKATRAVTELRDMQITNERFIRELEREKAGLLAELRLVRGKNATAELELAELDRENATLAGRANLAEEQLAAATLQEGQL